MNKSSPDNSATTKHEIKPYEVKCIIDKLSITYKAG